MLTKNKAKKNTSDETGDHYISATLYVDGKWVIWLTKKSDMTRKVFQEGQKLEVGGMSAEIVRIEGNAVVLKVGDKLGTIRIGNNLASWKASENTKTAEPNPSAAESNNGEADS